MDRTEHIEWCKKRALEYIDHGDSAQAFSSMASDLRKYEETEDHIGIELGINLLMAGKLQTAEEMREFIVGFA